MGANIFYLEKTQKAIEKSLVLYLLELIQVMQKMAMIQIMGLLVKKYLLVSSKIKNERTRKKINTRKGNQRASRKRNERENKKRFRRQK